MKTDINQIDKLISSIRFHSECYGVDRTIEPPHGLGKSLEQHVISAKQTYVDLRILLLRLENILWPEGKNGISNQEKIEEISNRGSSED